MTDDTYETLSERLQRRSAALSARRGRRAVGWCAALVLAVAVFIGAFVFGIELIAQVPRLWATFS